MSKVQGKETSVNPYEITHLSEHLSHSGHVDLLCSLVISNLWYETSTSFDPSMQLLRGDIEWAYQSADKAISYELLDTNDQYLAYLAALSWLSSRIGQSATLLTPNLFEALSQLGDGEQALRRAATIPDPVDRSTMLIHIGLGAFRADYSESARDIWVSTQTLLTTTPLDFGNELLNNKAHLVFALARSGDKDWAISIAHEVDTDIHAEIDHAAGVYSTNQYALARVWASVGEVERAIRVAHEPSDVGNKLYAIGEAAEVHFVVTKTLDQRFLDAALTLLPTELEERPARRLSEMLARFGRLDQAFKIAEESEIDNRLRILRAGMAGALVQEDEQLAEKYRNQIISEVSDNSDPTTRIRSRTNLILGRHNDFVGLSLADLTPALCQGFDEHVLELDRDTLGNCALAFAKLGDDVRANQAMSQALQIGLPVDDWDEAYTLIGFARQFGADGDSDRLEKVFQRSLVRSDPWQQAEVITAVAEAAYEMGNDAIFQSQQFPEVRDRKR